MDLEVVREQVLAEVAENMSFLLNSYPVDACAATYNELSKLFQALAICHLLTTDDVQKFRNNLIFSGYARRYFLSVAKAEPNESNRYLALSRSEAVLDAIVAGNLKLTRDIADLSSLVWHADWEYEDDWCFYQFVHQAAHSAGSPRGADIKQLLERWSGVLEEGGDDDLRLPICEALANGENDAVEETLQAFTESRETELSKKRDTLTDPYFLLWPGTFVNIEALALIWLATQSGMLIDPELPLCPMQARLPLIDEAPRDFFADLPEIQAAVD